MDTGTTVARDLLRAATNNGCIEMIRCLMAVGVDTKDVFGQTSLSLAAMNGYLEGVEFLVGARADMETKDHYSQTPLLQAVRCGQLKVVRFLANHGADLQVEDNCDRTPIMLAMFHEYPEIVEILKEVAEHRLRRQLVGMITKSAAHR